MKQTRKTNAASAAKRKAAVERDLQAMRDIADDVIESDFVPYACLFDAETLLTKNGELMHVIRITGQQLAMGGGDVRTALRNAIAKYIPDASYAIWLHTVRKRQNTGGVQNFPDDWSRDLDKTWRAQQANSASFANELTITLVKAGQPAKILDIAGVIRSLLPKSERARRTEYLEKAHRELTQVSDRLLAALSTHGARRLTTVERNGVFYGEHLEFLEKLINLQDRPMPLPRRDLSYVLTSGEITFGYNAMEVRNGEGIRHFAALMTVKEYKESTLRGIDQFLEIPCELIVTQCFDFVGAEAAQETYEKQAEYLRISGDKELAQWIEIDRLSGDTGDALAFGQQQTSIFLISPTVKQLEANVRMVQKSFSRIGIIVVREDLRIEECYWSQLPGNFPFLSRHHSIDSHHLAGFANLPAQPLGNVTGSSWGPPLSVFKTINDASYYFNLHRGQTAHTLLVGRHPAELAGTGHFLLAQARKLNANIWYLDGSGRGAGFLRAMGGEVLSPGTTQLRLNPLQMPDSTANREFLAVWISTLIDPLAQTLNRATLEFFQSLVAHVMTLPLGQRRLSSVLPILRQNDPMLAKHLQPWCEGGQYGEWFDMPQDNFSATSLIGWNIAPFLQNDALRIPLVSYLLHRITGSLNGSPTLIVLNDAMPLFNTPLFSTRISAWLDVLASRNAACIAMTSTIEYASAYPYARVLSDKAASIFVLPDEEIDGEYIMGYGLRDEDLGAIAHMAKSRHQLLLKRGSESTILRFDPSIFGGNEFTLKGETPTAPKSPKDVLAELMAPVGAA